MIIRVSEGGQKGSRNGVNKVILWDSPNAEVRFNDLRVWNPP